MWYLNDMGLPIGVSLNVPLGPRTTLGVGGPAWAFAEAEGPEHAQSLLSWAESESRPTTVVGGGSNLLVSETGFHGFVLRIAEQRVEMSTDGASAKVTASAGMTWDELVAKTVDLGLAGLECLSGIPGDVGAAPIQNIGAYGQEVAETLVEVEVLRRADGARLRLDNADCDFGYRSSRFKRDRDQFVVLSVTFALTPGGAPTLRYPELTRAVSDAPSLAEVRQAVLQIRRRKSMVLDPEDPNARSAGSFFTNPIVDEATADDVARIAAARGSAEPPRYAAEGGTKLSAAWLIEQAGFQKGYTKGRAGLSTKHCLALVNRGEARAEDLVALAAEIRRGVRETFGVALVPEPVFLGFGEETCALLDR